MMLSLKLKYSVRQAEPRDADRVIELVQRTNQFNTTTIRYSTAEITRMIDDPSTGLYVASLADRFGELGVVAVVVFNRNDSCFDLVAMSCRAMGFGLEIAVIADIIEAEGATSFLGRFRPTERNQPAADLFERAGFRRSGDDLWLLDGSDAAPRAPAWLASAARR